MITQVKGRPGKAARDGPLVGTALRRHQIAGKSLELQLPSAGRKVVVARLTASGTVATLEIGQSAAKRYVLRDTRAVQRLNGDG